MCSRSPGSAISEHDTLYADCFELGAFEEQQMQAEARSALPLSARRWTFQRNQWTGVPPRELHPPGQGNSISGEATGKDSMPRELLSQALTLSSEG